jgi:transmembrane sensor
MSDPRPNFGSPDAPTDWEAIARYLAGESPDAEADAVRAWLVARPADAELVTALDRTLDRLAVTPTAEIDVEAALQRAIARRDGERDAADVRPIRRVPTVSARRSLWRSPGLRAAAAVLVVAAGGLFWRVRQPASVAPARTFATGVGQRDSVSLPDGSHVVLGPSSRLVIASGYGDPNREVELTGEGYFEVKHDDAHTFTVRAGTATIRDVGTVFTVRTGDADRVRVAVREGAVLLDGASAGRGVVLHQGDVGVVQGTGHAQAQRGTATSDDVAWTAGRLVFREAPLSEVAAELRRWYGLELRVTDSALARRPLTASFAGDTPDHVLEVIGLALGARVERHGDTAVVRPAEGAR